jgi:hypothetical protein
MAAAAVGVAAPPSGVENGEMRVRRVLLWRWLLWRWLLR